MLANYFGKAIGCGVGIVRLEGDQRRCPDIKVVEINLRHILGISREGLGVNPESAGAGNEPERSERCLATGWVIQVGSGAEESQPGFVYGTGAEGFGITYHKLLGASRRLRGETWHVCAAGGQRVQDCRVVKVIVERPIPSLLVA